MHGTEDSPADGHPPAGGITDGARRQALGRDAVRAMVDDVLADRLDMDRFGVWLEGTATAVPSAEEIAGVADALRSR
ncbi:MAG: hypothetical protein EBZ59_07330, partial [Planctomycetia bacterium]|nr:hypothetical protein [Planctomycetia bacterium]